MPRFFCPGCWTDFGEHLCECLLCGLDICAFWESKDYVENLILALNHPEPATPIRAAWLLGKTKDQRAVDALMDLIGRTVDVYIARAAVKVLGGWILWKQGSSLALSPPILQA